MSELPQVSLEMIRSVIQNFTIVATLVLLYSFIPDTLRSRSRLLHPFAIGMVFGIAAAVSIPAFWMDGGGPALGFNIVLVPLAGFIGGPIATVFVAAVLLAGGFVSSGTLVAPDILTVMNGILLGSLFYYGRTRDRFPRKARVQIVLLGLGVILIEAVSFIVAIRQQPGAGPVPAISALVTILPFLLSSCVVTILLGSLIIFIDRKKQAEKELLDHQHHLEDMVTERTAELHRVNSLQQATIESTADGIVVVDTNGIIHAYNQKAARILAIPDPASLEKAARQDRHLTGRTFPEMAAAVLEDPAGFFNLVGLLSESAEQIVTTGTRFRNGRIYEIYVHPHRTDGHSIGRVWSFHDITSQKLAQDAITVAHNKLLLLASLTRHDIFNQMTALSAYLEMVDMRSRDPAVKAQIDAMRKSLEVIRLQLEFTRDYEIVGLKKPGWEPVERAFDTAAGSFGGRGVTYECTTGPVEICADPMIGQVFYNLIDNSFRHGGKLSVIRVSAGRDGPALLILYEDDGVGVPQEEKEKIFLRGFGKHTGLGMFLIKEILSITGITIRESGNFGRGARFEIRVPEGRFRFR
jgi:signal transduction histidine kinase